MLPYLNQCGVRGLTESGSVNHPPTAEEFLEVVSYLKFHGVTSAVIGSSAVVYHIKTSVKDYRPTVDLDLWVNRKLPAPPAGWYRDPQSIGIDSWISPTGGTVDFLKAGHRFPSGSVVPSKIDFVVSDDGKFNVAKLVEVFKLKLDSEREKDMLDCVVIARSLGYVPSARELGVLTDQQVETLNMVQAWVNARPHGGWGE